MEMISYIREIKEYTDLKGLEGEDLADELIKSVHRLKQEQDSWSDEKKRRINKAGETWAYDKNHDKDIEKFRLELAKTIWNLLMLSEKYKAKIGDVMWEDIERRRIQNTPRNKEEFKNIILKKMMDKLYYQATWNSVEFDYPYTLKYEFMFLGTLEPQVAADYLLYIRDNAVVQAPLEESHVKKLLEEFVIYSEYSFGDSWAKSLQKSLGIDS